MVGVICCGHVMIFKWIYIGDFCCGRAGKSKVLLEILADLKVMGKTSTRVRNCPEVTISNSIFGLFVFLYVFLSFCLDITPIRCLKGLKCQKSLFVSKFKSGTE